MSQKHFLFVKNILETKPRSFIKTCESINDKTPNINPSFFSIFFVLSIFPPLFHLYVYFCIILINVILFK